MPARLETSLRALASPVVVVSLILLVLNDHLLKRAWPGLVTGKLSDVAGLVVAPLLLSVALATVGVRRPNPWACALTAAGFSAVKVSPAAAAVVSGWWSLTGFPTEMMADPADLLALPAVLVAWAVHRRVSQQQPVPWRRAAATAAAVALLPVCVVATAATSCEPREGVDRAWVAGGAWASAPTGLAHRLVVDVDGYALISVDATGAVTSLPQEDASRLGRPSGFGSIACDGTGSCWRIGAGGGLVVEVSTDDGATWETELSLSGKKSAEPVEGDAGCGQAATMRLVDLAVLPVEGGTEVAVAAQFGGMLLRSASGEWERTPYETLKGLPRAKAAGSASGFIGTVHDELPPGYPTPEPPTPPPSPATPPAPSPTCASPTRVTVTPNPSNGPPTSYDVCP